MSKKKSTIIKKEKRRAQRFVLALKAEHKLKGKNEWAEAFCKDISGTGIALLTSGPLKVGDKVELKASSQEEDFEPFTIACKVIRSKKILKNKFEAGLDFLKIKDRARFIEFICNKMVDVSLSDDSNL